MAEAKRDTHVESTSIELLGTECSWVPSGQSRRTERAELFRLAADLSGELTLPKGRTELPFRFVLPPGLPPSYRGKRARVEYTAHATAVLSWWPDARADFELHVDAPPAAPSEDKPSRFSSDPTGPKAKEPHLEGSLATTVFRPGAAFSGALALNNVQWNSYKAVVVSLIGLETVSLKGVRDSSKETLRYELVLPMDEVAEGEEVPFRFRLPTDIPHTMASTLWRLDWLMEARVKIRWASDMVLRVPVTVLAGEKQSEGPDVPLLAPPMVGSKRVEKIWDDAAGACDLKYRSGTIFGPLGATNLEIRREHRGGGGVFVVGTISYPSLNLDLSIEPLGRIRSYLQGGPILGHQGWDGTHVISCRDPDQVQPLLVTHFRQVLPAFPATTVTDHFSQVERQGSGQRLRRLLEFCNAVKALAAVLDELPHVTPPPKSMEEGLLSWQRLARRLGTTLETARMAVDGELDGQRAQAMTLWSPEGRAYQTAISLRPTLPIPNQSAFHYVGPELIRGSKPKGQARELVFQLLGLAGTSRPDPHGPARVLEAGADRIRLNLPGPTVDASAIVSRLEDLARLTVFLRPGQGPFR